MKHVFITGAAGFIGIHTVHVFIKKGWHVTALVHRRISKEFEQFAKSQALTIMKGDVTDIPALRSMLGAEVEGRGIMFDAVVHCAGRASDVGWRSGFRRTNFESVKGLVQIVKELNVGRFVFISTTDVYGLYDFNGESEDKLPLKSHPANPYPEFKIAAEKIIMAELPASQFCIVRPAQVWGVGDLTLTSRIVDFLKWSPWIIHFGKWHGLNRWPLAHVDNVAMAIFLATTHPDAAGLTINVIDDEKTTMEEFYRILAHLYLPDRRLRTVTIPFWIGQCAGAVVSAVSNLLNLRQPFLDPSFYALYAVSHNLDFSNKRMKELFAKAGYSIVSREDGVLQIKQSRSKEGQFT